MNFALLAKQGWRIANGEASLLFKVLEWPYFKQTPFFHAKLGSNPLFGWRRLLEGRKVLLKGSRWRVRDGRSIDVWKDPWVPRLGDFQLFGGGCALDILAMPLSRVPGRDKLMWHYTKCGKYITVSGYKCAKEMVTWGAREFSFAFPWCFNIGGRERSSFKEWWTSITALLGDQDQQEVILLIAYTLWELWKHKNGIFFSEARDNLNNILEYGTRLAEDSREHNNLNLAAWSREQRGEGGLQLLLFGGIIQYEW
ncbi:hypothetical protein LIER_30822 [Lithospermum erythrorhizon]|uniref:Uncharacterized protein n=1 Tax=Lithospermum erythrorhizon TaxID=34254 RepID=A0AAV3RSZ7_LITER